MCDRWDCGNIYDGLCYYDVLKKPRLCIEEEQEEDPEEYVWDTNE